MIEKFVPIDGYEGLYEVSNLGNVKSLGNNKFRKEKILSPKVMKNGYLIVELYKDGKTKNHYIHRLVANAFILNPLKLPVVHHKDENKLNNCVWNLQGVSHQFNLTYNDIRKKAGKKLSIPIYCVELDKVFQSTQEAERITGINDGNICSCLKCKRKTAGGYHWRYL